LRQGCPAAYKKAQPSAGQLFTQPSEDEAVRERARQSIDKRLPELEDEFGA
jgi:hypothetical protein